jgi:phosphatidylinositol alpha-1,6-mannosyltransferase
VLLVANNFPPVRGGSATVYDCLARCAAGRIAVLAPRVAYADGLPLIGWREHDRLAPYPIVRLNLLRTVIQPDGRRRGRLPRLAFIASDLAIRLRLTISILRLTRRFGARTVCVGELIANDWLLVLLRRLTRLRLVVYVHGEEITTADPYNAAGRRMRRGLRAADAVVAVSRFTREALAAVMGDDQRAKVTLIGNGVNSSRFVPGPRRPDLMARFGLGNGLIFVCVCRLLEKKGIDIALRAFAPIAAASPGTRFLVVGDGPYRPALDRIVEELGLHDSVVFTGRVPEDDLADCYRLGDVFVMPNRVLANGDTEGFGLVFLEANGCGLPVIAGRDGGSTDAVTDGVNGLVVDGHSEQSVAAAMRRLHDDPALRARLREGGLEAAARSDWSEKTRAFLALCEGANV